jgi:hypothetical protein
MIISAVLPRQVAMNYFDCLPPEIAAILFNDVYYGQTKDYKV